MYSEEEIKNLIVEDQDILGLLTEKQSQYTSAFKKKYGELDMDGEGRNAFTKAVAKATGISKSILDDVYDRGIGAAKTSGTRPSVKSDDQWAKARVYSFVMKGKTWSTADKDLAGKVKNDSIQTYTATYDNGSRTQ